jgi:hypothetical protein
VNTCQTCTHYTNDPTSDVAQGICRRFPPTPIKTSEERVTTMYPMTRPDMWCGEHAFAYATK